LTPEHPYMKDLKLIKIEKKHWTHNKGNETA